MDAPAVQELGTQVTLALMGAGILQWLKNRAWLPFVNAHSATINHVIMIISSGLFAIGIHFVWDSAAHSLTITGLSLTTILHGLFLWAKQWTYQFLVHRGVYGGVATSPTPALGTAVATK